MTPYVIISIASIPFFILGFKSLRIATAVDEETKQVTVRDNIVLGISLIMFTVAVLLIVEGYSWLESLRLL